ncbi:MAG: dihydroorotate dehydrogenase (quinone) [Chloroflexi bacterium]|nr:dihydroorotate dehydrogenase (quinone) [Chloroflexota bacterium]
MYSFFRPLLFKLDPETAHHLTLQLIRMGAYQPLNFLLRTMYAAPGKPVEAFGLHFPNPVGLAAGYDKDGLAWRGLATLGFGHIEIGTVTPLPQPGNPKPRVFRLVADRAVINRMGFPGLGAEYVAGRLRGNPGSSEVVPVPAYHPESRMSSRISYGTGRGTGRRRRISRCSYGNGRQVIVGVNLGKNKDTPLENAASDYITLMRQFTLLADYFAINVSSPNTDGLRRLQGREMLEGLLGAIAKERENIVAGRGGRTPILVKLSPDLSDEELDDALEVIVRAGMDGVIATNTSLGRAGLRLDRREETGGLSGEPLRVRSEEVLRSVVKKLGGRLPVISVGGIMRPEDARARLDAGAALVQVYTGLVYAGPGLVKQILQKL